MARPRDDSLPTPAPSALCIATGARSGARAPSASVQATLWPAMSPPWGAAITVVTPAARVIAIAVAPGS